MKKQIFLTSILVNLIIYSVALCSDPLCFNKAGMMYNISPDLLKAISWTESRHNNNAINWNNNGTYDYCHMQINSAWYQSLGHDKWISIANPCACTIVGAEILKKCIDVYGYTWEAVGCYNASSKNKRIKYAYKIYNVIQRIKK